MAIEIMTRENSRWDDFTNRLGGAEGCNFQEGKDKKITWNCDSSSTRPIATRILTDMGNIDIGKTMEYFNRHGGHCDCEILFNIDK